MKDSLTWSNVQNWIPLIIIAVTVGGAFSALDRRLALVEQKLNDLIVLQTNQIQKYSEVELRYSQLATRVTILETKLK